MSFSSSSIRKLFPHPSVLVPLVIAVIFADMHFIVCDGCCEESAEIEAQEEPALTYEAAITSDFLGNVRGGSKRGFINLHNIDAAATLDTEKAKLWDGGQAFVYFLGNFGDRVTDYAGDTQATSNIETGSDSFKLYEAWYDHTFLEGTTSLLFGLHDYNSEFNSLDYAGTLTNSSFGIEPDISQVGPSIFPTTALGGRLRVQPIETGYGMFAVYDGVPGSTTNSKWTHIKVSEDDGAFYALELGTISSEADAVGNYYKVALGGWYHTTNYTDYTDSGRSNNRGGYLIAEKQMFAECDDPKQGLGVFFQIGTAQPDRNEIGRYLGGGLTYTGLFPTRDEDVFSIGVASAARSAEYRRTIETSGQAETTFEFTYRAPIIDHLVLQPDVQIVRNPSTDAALDNAVIVGIRTEVSL